MNIELKWCKLTHITYNGVREDPLYSCEIEVTEDHFPVPLRTFWPEVIIDLRHARIDLLTFETAECEDLTSGEGNISILLSKEDLETLEQLKALK